MGNRQVFHHIVKDQNRPVGSSLIVRNLFNVSRLVAGGRHAGACEPQRNALFPVMPPDHIASDKRVEAPHDVFGDDMSFAPGE